MKRRPRLLLLILLPALAARAGEESLAKLERQMAELVNRDRAEHKLPPLSYRDDLAAVARAHSLDMKANRFFAHESKTTGRPHDRVTKARIGHRGVGENIAVSQTVETGEAMLMLSKRHRENILNPKYEQIGVGMVRNEQGWLVITQLFLIPTPEHDVDEARKRILEGINKARQAKGLRRLVEDAQLTRRAQSHSERAARLGKPDPLWLEDRLAEDGNHWAIHEAEFSLTDRIEQIIHSPVAQSKRHDHIGLGIVQAPVESKASGALWITLVCAQKR